MSTYPENFQPKTEYQTRKELIDPVLKKVGWMDRYIKEEVNSVKSDFKNKDFILFKGNPEHNVDYNHLLIV